MNSLFLADLDLTQPSYDIYLENPNMSPKKSESPTFHDDDFFFVSGSCDDDSEVYRLTEELKAINETVTNECEDIAQKSVNSGSSALIYEMSGNPNLYMKISDLPYNSFIYSKADIAGVGCNIIKDKLYVSINEIQNSLEYEKLVYVFPHNIMQIDSTYQCKKQYSASTFFANAFIIEKVNGITLNDALETMNMKQIICCIMQIVYILSYANLHGYIHNDITTHNIMIYYDTSINNLLFNKLRLLDTHNNNIFVHLNMNFPPELPFPIVKLIDFSLSAKIIPSSGNVVIGEPQQILLLLRNKLTTLVSHNESIEIGEKSIFEKILKAFTSLNQGNEMLNAIYLELSGRNASVTGFRTLSIEDMISTELPLSFAYNKLIKIFTTLSNFFASDPNYGINIDLVIMQQQLPQIEKKKKIFSQITKSQQTVKLPQIFDFTKQSAGYNPKDEANYIKYMLMLAKTSNLIDKFLQNSQL